MEKPNLQTGKHMTKEALFTSTTDVNLEPTDLDELYNRWSERILENIASFQNCGSGWVFKSIVDLSVHTVTYKPMSGSSYIPTPKDIAKKKAIINLRNHDDQCFKYSITRGINPVYDNPNRVDKKLKAKSKELNWEDIPFPTSLKDIAKFERNNPTISVNVLGYVEKNSSERLYKNKVYPLRSQNVSFVVYADFESFTTPIQTCQPEVSQKTTKYQKHEPSGFCYYIKCFDDSVYTQEPVKFTKESEDQDVAQIFVETLEQNIKEIHQQFKFQKKMIFGEQEREIFKKSTHCHICKDPLTPDDKDNYNVRDHCHYKGTFRGAAHNQCNLAYRNPKFFPVIFHNLAGYDAHLFIKNLAKTEGEIDCIPSNEEKYISFTKKILVDTFTNKEGKEVDVKRDLRFIDSFKFMAAGLGKLVENLDEFSELPKFYQDEQLQLLMRKGVYPYDHVNSLEKLQETSLPPKDAFYSKLNEEHISDEDYEHAQKVWDTFGMKTMREYHDLYLKSDVLLLADVFENFRKTSLENYELDPCWYYTAPGLTYDGMLKTTSKRLELLTEYDKALFFEKNKRGGVSTISTRYAKANNKYMGDDYDPSEPTKHIVYIDANNLYGWAMSQPLPVGDFSGCRQKS
ncbi:uncharacterized protein [Amphiura filiformis]|uniref:uncharacterized protein n=1 Tax=Amphiura filiformis TaxID=82378 RepID=UPI003B22795D